jgi:hypothetical protein
MLVVVNHIADLFSGTYVNTSSARGHFVYYIQVRHWDKERNWQTNIEPELNEENRLFKNYLEKGDVLLSTKGGPPFAVIYDGRYAPAIASSVFTVLRIKEINSILPTYLQWFLNHPSTIKKLVEAAKGTSTQHIAKDVIEQLELPVPSIKKQEMIIQANTLQQKAMQLRTRIDHLNNTIFSNNLLQTANS